MKFGASLSNLTNKVGWSWSNTEHSCLEHIIWPCISVTDIAACKSEVFKMLFWKQMPSRQCQISWDKQNIVYAQYAYGNSAPPIVPRMFPQLIFTWNTFSGKLLHYSLAFLFRAEYLTNTGRNAFGMGSRMSPCEGLKNSNYWYPKFTPPKEWSRSRSTSLNRSVGAHLVSWKCRQSSSVRNRSE
jgi:hypothetical protein